MTLATGPIPRVSGVGRYEAGEARIHGVGEALKLSSNENPYGPSPMARAALERSCLKPEAYPSSDHLQLRSAIGEVLGLEPDHIVCGAGSDEILGFLCRAFAGPGDEVIHSVHGFLMYPILARAVGARPVQVSERGRKTDIDAILAACTDRTRLVFIANPNNPTGTMISTAEIARLADGLPRQAILVLDGAYVEYAEGYDGGIELVGQLHNLVMTRTFSKIYGLAALRIGYGYGPRHIIDALEQMRAPFNVAGPSLGAAEAAMRDQQYIAECHAKNAYWRRWMADELSRLGIPSDESFANFVLARFDSQGEAAACDGHLRSCGIIVRRMEKYNLPSCLRISVGDERGCRMLVTALSAFKTGSRA